MRLGREYGTIARLCLFAACLMFAVHSDPVAAATVVDGGVFSITFHNTGESSDGFTGEQDWTSQQMDDVVASVRAWTSGIDDIPVRQVRLTFLWYNFSDSALGGAYNTIYGDWSQAYTRTELVWREGYDIGSGADATIVYDTDAAGYSWNFGAGTPSSSQIDFRSVVTHEIGHTLGFVSSYSSDSDTWWNGGVTAWDSFLRDDAGNSPTPGTSGSPGNFNQVDNPVWFVGPNAAAANDGNPVAVFAPASYAAGSSLTHLNEGTFPYYLMSPGISLGETERTVSNIEWGVIKDLGWSVIPEPMTVMLLMAGGAAVVLRRRRGSWAV